MNVAARVTVLSCVFAAAALAASPAHADDAKADQKAAAQALFERGRALVEQGNFTEACPKFAESQRLDPGIGTLLWLADCYESSGRTASAWAGFKEAAAAAALKHDEREHVARERASALEPRLPHMTIVVAPNAQAAGLEVRRDGVEIGSAEWGLPLPVDPGPHSVAATAPGHRAWSVTVDLPASGDTVRVPVPALAAGASDVAERDRTPFVVPTSSAPRRSSTGDAQRIAGATVAGLGLAGIIAGSVVSFDAKSTYDGAAASGNCNASNECNAAGKASRHEAFSLATIATVVMSAGAVAIVGGAVLFFTAPRRDALAIGIVPGRRGATARLEWTW